MRSRRLRICSGSITDFRFTALRFTALVYRPKVSELSLIRPWFTTPRARFIAPRAVVEGRAGGAAAAGGAASGRLRGAESCARVTESPAGTTAKGKRQWPSRIMAKSLTLSVFVRRQ